MTDDRELERYLKGDSAASKRYRGASRETPPPELDDAVVAYARAKARDKRRAAPWLAGLALAASMVLGINLAWNVYKSAPPPEAARQNTAPAAEPVAQMPAKGAQMEQVSPQEEGRVAGRARTEKAAELEAAKARAEMKKAEAASALASAAPAGEAAGGSAPAAAPSPAPASVQDRPAAYSRAAPATMLAERQAAPDQAKAQTPPLTEPQKIERLIQYIGSLQGAVFIRNGSDHPAAEAVDHLRMKLKYAGDHVKTADDFIRLCASESSITHKPYRIRFADGTERNSGDVLREQLRLMEVNR